MEKETLKSKLREMLSKGWGELLPGASEERKSDSYYRTKEPGEGPKSPDSRPIEPETPKASGIARLKWIFFSFALVYILVLAYHTPLLTAVGRYLVVAHVPENSDLIVCLGGGNVERGLAAADAFRRGLAPRLFVARELLPDGYDILKQRGGSYPERRELMILMMKGLGVPESAILSSETPSESTLTEAAQVRKLAKERNYRSLILLTSPTHSRRVWLVFRKAMEGEGIRLFVVPSAYSEFKAEEWWKTSRHLREVVLEYQKLVYYFFRGYV